MPLFLLLFLLVLSVRDLRCLGLRHPLLAKLVILLPVLDLLAWHVNET